MIKKILILFFFILFAVVFIFFATRRVNVVLIGTDNVEKNSYRADTIIFVSYKPFTEKISVLSIPRDTLIEFKHSKEKIKINAVYMKGFINGRNSGSKGSRYILDCVGNLLNIKVPFYVHIDYEGFIKIIDFIGGVKINVTKRMKYVDKAGKLDIDIIPGIHNFNGKKALEYTRYRTYEGGDIGRIARQQEFIKAIIKKVTKESTAKNLPEFIKTMYKYIDTNLKITDIIIFANKIKNIDDIKIDILPGESIYVKGVSYWYPDYQKIQFILKEMLN